MLKELFYLDIETAGVYPDYKTFKLNDEIGANIFHKKYEKYRWNESYESIDEAYEKNSGIISTFGKIICISFGFLNNKGESKIKSIYGDDEEKIVRDFNEVIKKIEKKNFNICGFRILHFDIVYILHKLHKYRIKPANIIYNYDKKPWEYRITDISEDWKGKFAISYSFEELCYQLGLSSPKDKLNGSDVHSTYWKGEIEKIVEYCEKDVNSCIEISKIIYPGLYSFHT